MHEPAHRERIATRVIGEKTGTVEVHAAVGRHAAVFRLERQVAAGVDAHALVIDGIAEQQRRHVDLAWREGARQAFHASVSRPVRLRAAPRPSAPAR
jgi:post-segregation antitoxin (ccd killing protein)